MSVRGKIDWLAFESDLRRVFDDQPKALIGEWDRIEMQNALVRISDAIGFHTGRGYPLEDHPSQFGFATFKEC